MLDVLVVDDDETVRRSIADALTTVGHRVAQATDGEDALRWLGSHPVDLALCDVHMPKLGGIALLRRLKHEAPGVVVVMMTSFGRIEDVLSTLRDGAVDYVTKPFDPDDFAKRVVGPIAERRAVMQKFEETRARAESVSAGSPIVGESVAIRRLLRRLDVVARTDAAVLVTGERGTGKKLVAETLHVRGARREGPFLVVPCATLPDLMLEAELRQLADGNAERHRDDWFRAAEGGTLVLDGVDRLSVGGQSALLRVLSDPLTRAGRTADWRPRGVRVIATSQRPVQALREDPTFLEPLFFRLDATELRVPTLRERDGDMYPLVVHFLALHTPPRRRAPGLTPRAWRALSSFPFPGNVSQMSWIVQHALALADGAEIDLMHLPAEVRDETTS